MFRRMRILASGRVLDDIDMYERVQDMFSMASATDSRYTAYGVGFSNYWESRAVGSDPLNLKVFHMLTQ